MIDLSKSLEELEDSRWGEPEWPSGVVRAAHALRKKPLSTLTIEDLRLCVSQSLGLQFVLPLVLGLLRVNPLAEGDLFAGDLLSSVLSNQSEVLKFLSPAEQGELLVIASNAYEASDDEGFIEHINFDLDRLRRGLGRA